MTVHNLLVSVTIYIHTYIHTIPQQVIISSLQNLLFSLGTFQTNFRISESIVCGCPYRSDHPPTPSSAFSTFLGTPCKHRMWMIPYILYQVTMAEEGGSSCLELFSFSLFCLSLLAEFAFKLGIPFKMTS